MTSDTPQRSIVHLINPRAAGDPACFACAALINNAPAWANHICIIAAHADDAPRAQLLGLPSRHRIPPRATAPLSRTRQLKSIWRSLGHLPDLLIVWPGMDMPAPTPGIHVISADRLDAGPWPIDAQLIGAHDRNEVRTSWGIPDDARVIVSIAEPAPACDGWTAAYLGAVLTLATPPIWTIVPAGAQEVDRGLRFVERHEHRWGLIVDDAPLPRLLAGADAVMHACSSSWSNDLARPRANGLIWAAAHALPIVAQNSAAIDAGAPHMAHARVVPPGNRRALAHAMSKALLDEQVDARTALARQLVEERTTVAYSRRAHEYLYTQCQQSPTALLRGA